MENAKIFKKLKQRYVYLEQLGYDVLFVALQGSQNYGLDLYTDEYTSDIDCVAVILPSIEDIINSKPEVSTTIILDNNEHISVKDIRQMFKMYQKQNVQFLETLFTDYKIVNKKYKQELDKLFKMSYNISNINRKSFCYNVIGIALQKDKAFNTIYDGTQSEINKYGYSGKSLYHQIRINHFIHNIFEGKDFKTAMWVTDTNIKDSCLKAKLCEYDYDTAVMINKTYLEDTQSFKDKINLEEKDNTEYVEALEDLKAVILKKKFTDDLTPPIVIEYKLCPDQYSNVWVTSDTHFGHTNIIKYENRDVKLNIETIEQHDQVLIDNWNRVVGKNDLVLILGDFSFRKAKDTETLLKELNGDKVLIRGNHDIFLDDKKFDKTLFKAIYDYKEIKYNGQEIALMHYPIQSFKHMEKEVNPAILLFGHIHSFRVPIPRHSFNVGTDVNNYTPVNLREAITKALENDGGQYNV